MVLVLCTKRLLGTVVVYASTSKVSRILSSWTKTWTPAGAVYIDIHDKLPSTWSFLSRISPRDGKFTYPVSIWQQRPASCHAQGLLARVVHWNLDSHPFPHGGGHCVRNDRRHPGRSWRQFRWMRTISTPCGANTINVIWELDILVRFLWLLGL